MHFKSKNLKFLKYGLIASSICLIFFSCSNDEDEKPIENYISIENREHVLAKGYLHNDGSYVLDGVNADNNTVLLTTDGINYSLSTDTWSGSGTGIYFWFWSTLGTELDTGTYDFVSDGDEENAFTFSFTFFFENQSYQSDFSANQVDGGTVVISDVGNEKLIEFNLTSKGKNIKGRYQGNLLEMKD